MVTVLNMDVRDNARKYFLHWQHSPELLPSVDLAVVADGVDTDELYAVTWKRWERKRGQEKPAASVLGVSKKPSVLASCWRLMMKQKCSQGTNSPEIKITMEKRALENRVRKASSQQN